MFHFFFFLQQRIQSPEKRDHITEYSTDKYSVFIFYPLHYPVKSLFFPIPCPSLHLKNLDQGQTNMNRLRLSIQSESSVSLGIQYAYI